MAEVLLPEKAQTNKAGHVAIKHIQPRPAKIKIGEELRYITSVRANISLAYVQPDHLSAALSLMGGCCGGKKKQHQFLLANADDVRQWTNGGGR